MYGFTFIRTWVKIVMYGCTESGFRTFLRISEKRSVHPYILWALMISCTDFRKSVHKIRTSVHKIRTSGFKSVHMLFKFYLFFTCHSCIWKVMSLEPYIFSQDIGWKKTVIWFSMKKRYEFCLNRVWNKDLYTKTKSFSQITLQTTSGFVTTKL